MSKIGIIGGSGLYDIEGMKVVDTVKVDTPYGAASDEFTIGNLGGREIIFLPRHGNHHTVSPSEINYRANIFAMKKMGVERIISVAAVGSLKKEVKPRDFLIPDQFIDRTNQARKTTFFENGIVAHVGFADPVCPVTSKLLNEAGANLDVTIHHGGTYVNMEGPAFSTRAESNLYRSWGMDIIGMTNMTEARLAREAEICYAVLAMITDYDCWYVTEEEVTVEMILENAKMNITNAKKLLKEVIEKLPSQRSCFCAKALSGAIVTASENIPKETKDALKPIIGNYV
jgi:5'-methylthioadenosine phosphorylase